MKSTRAGSHAGRGFRYQDAAAAWLAVRCWAGDLEYGSVTPEGLDDAELAGSGGTAFLQMKSRRDQLGSYACGDVAAFLRELWERAEGSPLEPHKVVLVLERGVHGTEVEPGAITPLVESGALVGLVSNHRLSKRWMACTEIVVAPTPAESAIELLVQRLSCAPLMAAVYFAAIADRVGRLSDDNGERAPGDFLALSVSDIEREIERLAGVLSAADLDAAIRQGLCEPVDFLTPLNDPNLYLGADVQPGHLAAGLLAERPEARARVLDALERGRAVLIAGPSGSGKSGLMWEVARNSRHTVRWFRVRRAEEGDAVELLRLADRFRATAHMPVGFVVDDVGRNRSGLWDALATEAASRSNVLLLGSVREEDVFLVTRRSLVTEIRQLPDSGLAERIWQELRSRDQTDWPGWREPWQLSGGLLLEYAHLLTQGRRLWDVLKEQVDRRAREKRRVELAVLRVTSMAGRAGATVCHSRLSRTLDLSDDDLSDALRRLNDEHLVTRLSGDRIGSLHQIRAAALADITHEVPPPEKRETVQQALTCIDRQDIESFVARTLAIDFELAGAIVTGAVERIRREQDLGLVAPLMRGLDAGSIGDTIERWLPEVGRLGIPPTQATTAAMFAVAKTEPFLEDRLHAYFEAATLLRATPHHDSRQLLLDRLEPHLPLLLPEDPDWRAVTGLLAGLVGTTLPHFLELHLAQLEPDLVVMPLAEAVDLLEAACCTTPGVARAWVDSVGQAALLDRLTHEMAWISSASLRIEAEGLAVCADVLHVSDRLQSDAHGQVVELCRVLLALAPTADLAIASAMAPDGKPAGIDKPIAAKRIPRANLPARAVTTRNRRWLAAVAQKVAPMGLTRYLAEAKGHLDTLVPPLRNVVDGVIRGKVRDRYLEPLGRVHEAAEFLSRPPDAEELEAMAAFSVSDLQSVLHFCSADLVRALIELPDRAAASHSRATDVLAQIDRASVQEPWVLLGDGPPQSMAHLRGLVEQVRSIIGEAGARRVKPNQLCPQLVKSASSTKALARLSSWVERQIEGRLGRLTKALDATLSAQGYRGRASSHRVNDIGGPWPYAEALVVVVLERVEDWFSALAVIAEPLREACGEGRRLIIVPAVAGLSVPDQAVAGVKTLFPLLVADTAWLEELGFPPADLPLTRLFDELAAALLEASAIEAFGCAVEGRAGEERSTFDDAVRKISSGRDSLELSLRELGQAELAPHLDGFRAMGPALAREYWAGIHAGTASETVLVMTALKLRIIDEDLKTALRSASPP